jgi:hypothetical protein
MKITVKKADISIIVDETDNDIISKDKKTSIRWDDQMGNVHQTIIVMVEQLNKLKDSN